MEWHQYLREERAQKIKGLMRFLAGDLTMVEARGPDRVEATELAIERLRKNIADIEEILTAAGVPLDEEAALIIEAV